MRERERERERESERERERERERMLELCCVRVLDGEGSNVFASTVVEL